jgi:hypothetical protein
METTNKVMTVSYGTFSCTLDGFDDPFTTMQHVAEYFRKLAAQDRYFGGEPLQPDHNALHKIAQDANPYKVDAEVTDTGITLRKADVVDAPVAKDNAPAPQPAPVESIDRAPLFTSKRTTPEAIETPVETALAEADTPIVDEETASFVEAAVFATRRGALASADDEPTQSAAELLAEEDLADEASDVDLAAQADSIKAQIDQEVIASVEEEAPKAEIDELAIEESEEVADQTAEIEAIRAQITEEVTASEEPVDTAEADAVAVEKSTQRNSGDDIQREEEALERLLETTNSKLENPAHTRKSNALERLKAAVAATDAERRMRAETEKTARPKVQDLGSAAEFKSRLGDVRRNHEEVVKISRPKAKKTGDRARGSFATLILGKDQRVGKNTAAEAAAPAKKLGADGQQPAEHAQTPAQNRTKPALKIVRPEEEVEAHKEIKQPSGFASFAEKLGASSLHELLEASAAYLTLVEEEPRFSQDQLLETLSGYLSEKEVSPEATSRSLNRLMRDGRILRVKKDSYTISKSARHGFRDRIAS